MKSNLLSGWKALYLILFFSSNTSAQTPFITTWATTSLNEEITIPTRSGESYNYDVNWGDGNITYGHTGDATHLFQLSGTHQVLITGNFPHIDFSNSDQTNRNKIISIDQWGTQEWNSMEKAFKNCTNLELLASDSPNLENVTSLREMFYYVEAFDQNIGSWDVSNITVMNSMLKGTEMSQENYDALLLGWSDQELQNYVNFHGGNSSYCLGAEAREYIIDTYGWTMIDGGYECNIPECTNLLSPQNGENNVDITTEFTWEAAAAATGYKLSMGTYPDGNDLIDNLDVGNVTSYNPVDLLCGATIYVAITPYNSEGDAIDCNEEFFTTEFVEASAGNDVLICYGSNIQLNASGGTHYAWSPSDGLDDPHIATPIANPTTSTVYTVFVSNENGCMDTDDVTVTVNPFLDVYIVSTGETGENQNDGTATANPSGGTEPFIYQWSNGETTQTIENLAPGEYHLTVTDANQCTAIESVSINASGCGSHEIVSQQINETCHNSCDGVIAIINVMNSTPPLLYSWSNGASDPLLNNLCGGSYIVTITDAENCIIIDSFNIHSQNEIIIQIDTVYNIIENGYGAILLSTNDNGSYSYFWTGPENYTNNQLIIINLGVAGCYTLEVTDNDSGCSQDTTICILDLTSISDIKPLELHLYPNPTTSIVHLPFTFPVSHIDEIRVFDVLGIEYTINQISEWTYELPLSNNQYILMIRLLDGDRYLGKVQILH